jgi:hypothetical protein
LEESVPINKFEGTLIGVVYSGYGERNKALPGLPPIFFNVLFISEASIAFYIKTVFGIAQQ